jgi:hypothetical protein
MREAIGTSYVISFIVTFFVLFILIFIGTLSYTKAFKVKNRIVDIIESHEGNIEKISGSLDTNVENEINSKLNQIGYRISNESKCKTDGRFSTGTVLKKSSKSTYRYCIYKFTSNNDKIGDYYGVVTYIYFDIPIIGSRLQFPVYGETRTFGLMNTKG